MRSGYTQPIRGQKRGKNLLWQDEERISGSAKMVAGRGGISVVGKRATRLSGAIFMGTPILPSSRSFPGKRRSMLTVR